MVVAFRRHTLLPLDDCLYALQPSIPYLARSALHRCLQRHGISRRPDVEGDKPKRQRFKRYPIGFFHVDIAEVQTAEGKENKFVSLPMGIPVDTQEELPTNQRSVEFAALQSARNNLLNQIMAAAKDLKPGEERNLNLEIQLRRVNEEVGSMDPTAENPFVQVLKL